MMVGVCLLGERSERPGELFVGALNVHVSTHAREGLQRNALRKAPWSFLSHGYGTTWSRGRSMGQPWCEGRPSKEVCRVRKSELWWWLVRA